MQRKAQAALEFLVTYSWALLAILITVGALYYFGVFDFGRYLPQKCNFPVQFKCLDFVIKENEVKFKLLNNIGEPVNIVSFNITSDTIPALSCISPSIAGVWNNGVERDFTFTGCTAGGLTKSERFEAKITMRWNAENTPSHPVHEIKGAIQSIVQ